MKKPIGIKISQVGSRMSNVQSRVIAFLETLPNDTVIDTRELAERMGVSGNSCGLHSFILKPYFYSVQLSQKVKFWGNKKAIIALKAQYETKAKP